MATSMYNWDATQPTVYLLAGYPRYAMIATGEIFIPQHEFGPEVVWLRERVCSHTLGWCRGPGGLEEAGETWLVGLKLGHIPPNHSAMIFPIDLWKSFSPYESVGKSSICMDDFPANHVWLADGIFPTIMTIFWVIPRRTRMVALQFNESNLSVFRDVVHLSLETFWGPLSVIDRDQDCANIVTMDV